MFAKTLSISMALLICSACSSYSPMSTDYGYSTRHNTKLHRVDPTAEGKARPMASSDGQKIEQAMKQYRKEKVLQANTRDRVVVGLSN